MVIFVCGVLLNRFHINESDNLQILVKFVINFTDLSKTDIIFTNICKGVILVEDLQLIKTYN